MTEIVNTTRQQQQQQQQQQRQRQQQQQPQPQRQLTQQEEYQAQVLKTAVASAREMKKELDLALTKKEQIVLLAKAPDLGPEMVEVLQLRLEVAEQDILYWKEQIKVNLIYS